MSLTLNATLSDEDAESYISVAAANSYHEKGSGNTTWTALSGDDKIRALIGATDLLERLDFWGEKTVYNQIEDKMRVFPEKLSPKVDTYIQEIGYLEVPNSFTADTTAVTSGMIKNFTEAIDFTP